MIGLNEEQIWDLIGESKTTYEEDLCIVAKAQLKRVVEWMLDNELHPECDGLELSGKSLLTLLEEIKG